MRKKSLTNRLSMATVAVFALAAATVGVLPQPANAAINPDLQGFRANEGGGGALDTGWTGGNLGNSWAEGEWVPYKLVLNKVQDSYPGLTGISIEVSYDFTSADYRFIDLVRGLQVGTADLSDVQGWPMDDGSAYPIDTRSGIEAAQNDVGNVAPTDNVWSGFTLLDPTAVNVALDGSTGTPTDGRRKFVVTADDLLAAGIPSDANTIVLYWQLHESRSFIWEHSLQEGYGVSPTDVWGGYVYDDGGAFAADSRVGSGYVPGSSGHIHLETLSGSSDVPIPIPDALPGTISGMKWEDDNGDGVMDEGELPLAGWPIHVFGTVEGITFSTQTAADGTGMYSFPNLTSGTTWTIKEVEDPFSLGYEQTYPYSGVTVGLGSSVAVSAPPEGAGAYGWEVELTLDNPNQTDLDFGNRIPPAYLTLLKHVVNDNGGTATVGDFNVYLNDAATTWSTHELVAGTYVVSEDTLPGYTPSAWGGDCAEDGSITLEPGQEAVCEITNDDEQAYVTVIKEVMNDDGGTAGPDDFGLTLSGMPVRSGVAVPVDPGTYAAGETLLPGYAFTGFSGDCDDRGSVTVALGESKTCVLSNDDIAPTLTLIKEVVNNDGGTAVADDFQGLIDGLHVSWGTAVTLTAGVHDAGEIGLPTYEASDWSGDCAADGSVSLSVGENKTCYITNDDIAPTLTLVKTVVNGDGGTLTHEDFQGRIDGIDVAWGVPVTLPVGGYTASELEVPGYAASDWSGDCAADGSVSLGLAEDKTCYITNDDIAPTLTIIKEVVNDDGGTATPADFQGRIDGMDVDWAVPVVLTAGAHAASEVGLYGYAAGDWTGACAPDGSVTLALDEDAVCYITNDDIAPTLTLVKTVINDNGGTLTPADFPAFVSGIPVVWGDATALVAGDYTASETGQHGYAAGEWTGDCAADGTVSLAVGDEKTCYITNDDIDPTITIVKDAVPNDLKDFLFSLTGQADFWLDDDEGVQGIGDGLDIDRPRSMTFDVNVGTFTVTEHVPEFWNLTGVVCVDSVTGAEFPSVLDGTGVTVSLGLDQHVTCTFTNGKDGGSLTRTQGFWKTHTDFTSAVFTVFAGGSMTLGDTPGGSDIIDSVEELFGSYYASIPKTTLKGKDGKRDEDDQARMILAHQLVTAKLNCAAFGCSAAVQAIVAAGDAAYSAGDTAALVAAADALDVYNNSGDTLIIEADFPVSPGHATPSVSLLLADIAYWDTQWHD